MLSVRSENSATLVSSIAVPAVAMAQLKSPTDVKLPEVQSLESLTGVSNWVIAITDWLFYFLILLTFVFILIAAYKYLTSSGDPEKVKGANQMLLYAAIAVVVGILAKTIPNLVASIVGS